MEVEQNQSKTRWSQEKFQRISELENSKEYQDRLFLMKEQMKSNLHWRAVTILGIILAILSFLLFRLRAVIIIFLFSFSIIYLNTKKGRLYSGIMLGPMMKFILTIFSVLF